MTFSSHPLPANDVRDGSRRTADTSSAWRGRPMANRLFSPPTGLEPIRCGGSDAHGGAIERVPGIAENVSDPVFSRDGKTLAYSQFYIDTNIWRMDIATGESPPVHRVHAIRIEPTIFVRRQTRRVPIQPIRSR